MQDICFLEVTRERAIGKRRRKRITYIYTKKKNRGEMSSISFFFFLVLFCFWWNIITSFPLCDINASTIWPPRVDKFTGDDRTEMKRLNTEHHAKKNIEKIIVSKFLFYFLLLSSRSIFCFHSYLPKAAYMTYLFGCASCPWSKQKFRAVQLPLKRKW